MRELIRVLLFFWRCASRAGEASRAEGVKSSERTISSLHFPTMSAAPDPILLSLLSQRFMGIAEACGAVLALTSVSTNIRERLDYSCGVFDAQGELVANGGSSGRGPPLTEQRLIYRCTLARCRSP